MDDTLLGTDVGRYRLVRVIATGGMGRVYLAEQPAIGSRVAVKVLSEQCANDPELVERFFAEARAVNLIAHENIINVIDLATLPDGRPYIVMEYVDGKTLTRAAIGGSAPLGGVVHVLLDVLSALGAAHEIGIVHRDLKPDNIMITAKGNAKVLDFGIAKLSTPGSARTMTGALLGTPSYMAPEQVNGARDVDARADLYSVGAVLFHAVTGRPPFAGSTMFDIMRAQLEEQPPSPRTLRHDLPVELERVIMKALAKDPANRYASAAEMAAALDAAARTVPESQWVDLSTRTMPLRIRGSGPRITPTPRPARRDTPPAMSATNLPARSRWFVPLVGVAALASALVVFFALHENKRSVPVVAVVSVDAREVAVTPDVMQMEAQMQALDAAVAVVAVDAAPLVAKAEPASKRPILRPGVQPTAPARFDLRQYFPRAKQAATALAGVNDARLFAITVEGTPSDGVLDLTRGVVVRYSFVIDPPLDTGCEAIVSVGQTVRVDVKRGSCTREGIALPECRFSAIWARMLVEYSNIPDMAKRSPAFHYNGRTWAVVGYSTELTDHCP